MTMVSDVNAATGIIDSETVNNFGFESFVENLHNYAKLETGAITAGNVDHVTLKDLEFEPVVDPEHSHVRSIVYRALKPDNVLLTTKTHPVS